MQDLHCCTFDYITVVESFTKHQLVPVDSSKVRCWILDAIEMLKCGLQFQSDETKTLKSSWFYHPHLHERKKSILSRDTVLWGRVKSIGHVPSPSSVASCISSIAVKQAPQKHTTMFKGNNHSTYYVCTYSTQTNVPGSTNHPSDNNSNRIQSVLIHAFCVVYVVLHHHLPSMFLRELDNLHSVLSV